MRFYHALLHLYPASFRTEYGEEMCATFRLQRSATPRAAVPALWWRTILEVLSSAAQAHWDILRQDLRYGARAFTRSPGFALTALLVIALGIGATTGAFSLTDHVLIRPLPYSEPHRLVRLWESPPGYAQMEPSPANYRDWKEMSRDPATAIRIE
jgi:putative ABC transport system permease protein